MNIDTSRISMQTAASASPSIAQPLHRTLAGRIIIGLAATLVVALAAHVSIPLPFTPVPLTLQPLAVLCVGLFLGPVDGFFAMLAYLAEGASGLPVFSPQGPGGVAQLHSITGGFLMIYPVVAFVVGSITRSTQKLLPRFVAALLGCTVAVAVLFAAGSAWMMTAWHQTAQHAFALAVAPFAFSEAARIVIAAGLYSAAGRIRRA